MSSAFSDVNTYSLDGRIIQVEYAMKACSLGTTTIGVKLDDCVVLISEKKIVSKLQNPCSIKKHFKIYDTILGGISGVSGDAPTIIEKIRNICLNHEKLFAEQINTEKLMEDICDLALRFGENEFSKKIFSRPFGISLLIASFENNTPILYNIDPSGSFLQYKARAIGCASEVVETILENEFENFSTKDQCIVKLLEILKGVMKEKLTELNVEISYVNKDGTFMLTPEEIKFYIK
jgi:20S proteasome subunit alpha 5